MKFCVDYQRHFKYDKEIDEYTIYYRREDTTLVEFLLKYQDKRINISVSDAEMFLFEKDIERFDAIVKEYPDLNIYFKLRTYNDSFNKELFELLKEHGFKVFFGEFIIDYDTLNGYLALGVTDIYIVEELGFELKTIAELAHKCGTSVRVFPNVAQSSWKDTPALKKFWIRPEDVEKFSPYVDVMEFFGKPEQIATYYEIYAKEQLWYGKLNEIIISLNSDIDSRYLHFSFADRRINCEKRCMKGRPCRICDVIQELSETLEDHNLIIEK